MSCYFFQDEGHNRLQSYENSVNTPLKKHTKKRIFLFIPLFCVLLRSRRKGESRESHALLHGRSYAQGEGGRNIFPRAARAALLLLGDGGPGIIVERHLAEEEFALAVMELVVAMRHEEPFTVFLQQATVAYAIVAV